jgi:branched-chain amino acid transport system permease protein
VRTIFYPLVAGALLLLAACVFWVDAEQARVCRTALPALNSDGARISILRTAPWPEARSIRVEYRVEREGQPALVRHVICRFAAEGLSPNKAELIAIVTERGPVADSTLYLLKRFYIDTPEGTAAAPGPGQVNTNLPDVPATFAYALQQVVVALPKMAIYGLLATAYALVFGLVGRINLAFGELTAVGAAGTVIGVAAFLSGELTAPLPGLAIGLLCAIFAAGYYGAVGGHYTIARIPGPSQPSLIATVGLSLFLMEYLRLVQGSATVWIPPVWSESLPLLRSGDFVVSLTPMSLLTTGIGLATAAGLLALIRGTSYGRAWRAYADDPGAAALFGVNRRRLLITTLSLAGGTAGIVGTLVVAQFGGLGFADGFQLGLKALIAAVLGGIRSVAGAFLGGILIGAFEAAWSAVMPIDGRDIALYFILIVVLVFRPGGLLGAGGPNPRQV